MWHINRPLDVQAMSEAAGCLIGVHDFSSFACSGSETRTSVRNLMKIDIRRLGERVVIELRANAYLRSMVRVIVGTLVEVGLGERSGSEIAGILAAGDRRLAGKTAPPQGLCLVEVEY